MWVIPVFGYYSDSRCDRSRASFRRCTVSACLLSRGHHCLGGSLVLRSTMCSPIGSYCTDSSTRNSLWFCGSWSSHMLSMGLCAYVFLFSCGYSERLKNNAATTPILDRTTPQPCILFKDYIVFYNLCHEWTPTLRLNMWQEILIISSFFSPAFQAWKLRLAFCISSY